MSMLEGVMAAAALGLVTTPHCVAMCGPLAIAGCSKGGKLCRDDSGGYLLARLVGYATVGALMGHLGASALRHPAAVTVGRLLVVLLALGCAWQGIAVLRRRERLVALRRKSPRGSVRALLDAVSMLLPRRGAPLGLATAVLPCGALVAAWTIAATTGRATEGAVSMLAFGAVTTPALLTALVGRSLLTRWMSRMPRPLLAAAWLAVAALLLGRLWFFHEGACHG
jgi:sulfite exporter TauE/SafE